MTNKVVYLRVTREERMFARCSKKPVNRVTACPTLEVQVISRQECIANWAPPMSAVIMPKLVAIIGPMVEPLC